MLAGAAGGFACANDLTLCKKTLISMQQTPFNMLQHTRLRATVCLLLTILLAGCGKDGPPTLSPKIDVSEITRTDISGNLLTTTPDITDWTLDDTWTVEELELMETPATAQLLNAEMANITIHPGYPNPLANSFAFAFTASTPSFLQVVVTDDQLNVKLRHTRMANAGNNTLLFDASNTTDFVSKQHYRLYYAFYSAADGLYYKGHGDLRIER
jgi:glucose/arabinose dehydrogenase